MSESHLHLAKPAADRHTAPAQNGLQQTHDASAHLGRIIEILRSKTGHDFTLYKQGTLQRRIEQRMAMMPAGTRDMDRYLEILRGDSNELESLAKDLFIHVTSFFRDPQTFDFLAQEIIPDIVRNHPPDQPLRIWVAGCSTGEETYSLAMLFCETIAAARSSIKLQVFGSDVDADAVARAREGFYPKTIAQSVSPARLARFFSKEDNGYRILQTLRANVVFTVQDVLADPPFSRLDFVSCRNLLIYLNGDAQAKIVSTFHFALCDGGVLLLGGAETIANPNGRFELISKSHSLHRHTGHSRPGTLAFSRPSATAWSAPLPHSAPSRQAAFADLCRRMVSDVYAPAAVLINRKSECLYYMGPTDRYLKVAPGRPLHDLLAMARDGVRTKLRSAIQRASHQNARTVVTGGQTNHDGSMLSFSIAAVPVLSEGEELLLVCFVEEPTPERAPGHPPVPGEVPRISELEHELEATRTELQSAIHNLEISGEEQKAINEEALSANEEYQSTNEELLTSKEELQSLNEELTALNSQLQETLERQRTTSNDLQNVLYSTDVATLFLDTELNIRFFTPATKSLFRVIPGDVGRPLADLSSLAADSGLLQDARTVLHTLAPLEREIEAQSGAWYLRRILTYRTQDNGVDGVVITFADITERRRAATALETAERQAQTANLTKSRFLAAASHDLRQPLQTLALLQGQLAKISEGEKAQKLVARLQETLGAMTGMLNALLDINQIEVGSVHPETASFPIDDLLDRLRDEYTYHAEAQGLGLHVMTCGLSIHSDPRLLEQMIRNLLSNALKYTRRGRVLLGCRRRGGMLGIEVWDTGMGIPAEDLQTIFEEYHQLGNPARERSRGLGLGLSIVQRLGNLLGHRVLVRSWPGKGSVFSVEVALPQSQSMPPRERHRQSIEEGAVERVRRTGAILVVEDDPEVRELLELLLKDEGHYTVAAPDGVVALELVAQKTVRPDLILADYNLPNGLDGLELAGQLRIRLGRHIPVIILTGDISTGTLRRIAHEDCVQCNKPIKLKDLTQIIQRLLPRSQLAAHARVPHSAGAPGARRPVVFVVDDDSHVREAMRALLEDDGHTVFIYSSCEAFLEAYRPGREACLLVDACLPGMSGLELLRQLHDSGHRLPAIMITGNGDVSMAVQAMKGGASDFIEKPVGRGELLASIEHALELSQDSYKLSAGRAAAAHYIAGLSPRQRQIMEMVLAGHPSKNIAADLGISRRTVESHRASIMKKTGSKSLPALARLALAAARNETEETPIQGEFRHMAGR